MRTGVESTSNFGRCEDDPYNDGLLSASEISKLAPNARLVVLSACDSTKYDVHQASLGVQDLHGAFTLAGTPTLLASLWPVESSTARDLVVLFSTISYSNGLTKAALPRPGRGVATPGKIRPNPDGVLWIGNA